MKKLVSVILIIITAVSALAVPMSANAAKTSTRKSGVWKYTVSAGGAKIVKYTGKGGKVAVPSKLGGKKVTAIGNNSFLGKEKLTSVTIPKTVKTIGYSAFRECFKLKSIKLSNGLKTVDDFAFSGTGIKSVKIPNSVTKLGKYTFFCCSSMKKITLSKNIAEIPDNCFEDTKLEALKIPAKCKKIGEWVLFNTEKKIKISIGKGVKKISTRAFARDYTGLYNGSETITVSKKNKYFSSKNNALYNKKKTKLVFCAYQKERNSFRVPSSVKTIGKYAFVNYNTKLEKISLPEGLKKIDDYAFHLTGLTDLKIPSTVEYIGKSAFELTKIGSIKIPKSVKYIGKEAFSDTEAKTIEVDPNPELVLGEKVFRRSWKLAKVTYFPVKKSAGGTFSDCQSLTDVVIPETVTRVYSGDFYNCRELATVSVPDSVTKIDKEAFGYLNDDDEGAYRNDSFTMSGGRDSAAEKYAKVNGIDFTVN